MAIRLFNTPSGIVAQRDNALFRLAPETTWDALFQDEQLPENLATLLDGLAPIDAGEVAWNDRDDCPAELLPAIGHQEVWAAGVTYFKSRTARMEESQDAGGGTFYDRVYDADRPELFSKASAHRVSGPGQGIRTRRDSTWDVPEPELTLCVTPGGRIIGYCIGNDVSSRSIEGENPLYLPQAKTYDGCCGLGPGILVTAEPLDPESTNIRLEIEREGASVFDENIKLSSLKRKPEELVEFLTRETSFPQGVFLMTGTGIVPDHPFSLQHGDIVRISIDGIGTLSNPVVP